MRHETGTFVATGGIPLFTQAWLPEEEPKAGLVIVHGFGEHSGRYGNVVEFLVPRKYAIYTFDLRGHGRSPGPRGHVDRWDDYVEDVNAFLRHVRERLGPQPLFLFGHSMGGLIALDYALRHPEGLNGVIASGPVLAQPGVSPLLLMASRALSKVLPRTTFDTHLDATALSRDPEVVRAYQEDPLVHSLATARLGTELNNAIQRVHERASEWRLPLLILHGRADRLAPVEGSRAFIQNVPVEDKTLIEYPDGYHEPHNDIQKAVVLRDLEKWLDVHIS
ncbi:MAG: alpha/beta hydrolase [Chloroflexi bacterium]|nr:alpha/beta hydrolase [Chloroflexota bacterium]